jgi:hypothetical protein
MNCFSVTFDLTLSPTSFSVFIVVGTVSAASLVASLTVCIISRAAFVVSSTALTVSLIIPRSCCFF